MTEVPGSDWLAGQDEGLHKIAVLGDDNSLFTVGDRQDFLIRCTVAVGKVQGVHGVETRVLDPTRHSPWQLSVHEELHGFTGCMCLT